MVARDDRFDPACLEVPARSSVTLVVRNGGHHPHNLTLSGPGPDHVSVDAGQVAFLPVSVGTADVAFRCTIHPGMRGVLRVR